MRIGIIGYGFVGSAVAAAHDRNMLMINDPGKFEPVAESIDQKAVLTSSYPLHGINKLYEDLGFGHIGLD